MVQINVKREYPIFKANDLIQKSRFSLSLAEQKTVAYICSLLQENDPTYTPTPGEPWRLEYKFDIREYCQICGLDYDNGNNYAQVKATLKKLSDRSMWVPIDGEDVLCRWLAKVRTNKRSGIATIKLDDDMVPYLFGLKKYFTRYELINILGMKSAYSIRLYEVLKSYANMHEFEISVQKFKELMGIENLKTYKDFWYVREKVLDIAITEINRLTDLEVQYLLDRSGRGRGGSVKNIKFIISEKGTWERIQAQTNTLNILNGHIPGQTKLDLEGVNAEGNNDEW